MWQGIGLDETGVIRIPPLYSHVDSPASALASYAFLESPFLFVSQRSYFASGLLMIFMFFFFVPLRTFSSSCLLAVVCLLWYSYHLSLTLACVAVHHWGGF